MSLKPFFAKVFARNIYRKTQLWATNPVENAAKSFRGFNPSSGQHPIWLRPSFRPNKNF